MSITNIFNIFRRPIPPVSQHEELEKINKKEKQNPTKKSNDPKKIHLVCQMNLVPTYSYSHTENYKNFTPFTEKTSKSVHHNHVLNIINKFDSKKNFKIALITHAIMWIFIFLSLYLHNYLWLIPACISGAVSGHYFFTFFRDLNNSKTLKEITENLCRKKDDPQKQKALIFVPLTFSDSNKAFSSKYCEILGSLFKKYNLDVYFPLSTDHMNSIMQRKKYDQLLICAHGNKNIISFTPDFNLTKKNVDELNFSNLNKKASIGLFSCFTGALNGIAEKIALIARRKVFAPKSPALNFNPIRFSDNGEIYYKYIAPKFAVHKGGYYYYIPLPFLYKNITRVIDPDQVPDISAQFRTSLATTA